jgi:hypothetical protein
MIERARAWSAERSTGKQYSLLDLIKDLGSWGLFSFSWEARGYVAWALSRKTPQTKVPALPAPMLVIAGLCRLLVA